MSSAQVPLWVPILVGLLGVAGVVGGQVVTAIREERRWRREQEREDLRWKREKEKRDYEVKAAAYAQLIGAIEAMDSVLFRVRKELEPDTRRGLDEILSASLRDTTAESQRSLGPVNLHAPERIRVCLRESLLPRWDLSALLLNGRKREEWWPLWDKSQVEYQRMRAAMRLDLGLDAEEFDAKEFDAGEFDEGEAK